MSHRVAVIHGPNLNRLGTREPDIYGHLTLPELNQQLIDAGRAMKLDVHCAQSNHEGELVERIHALPDAETRVLILNAAGLTHTSVVLRDAVLSLPASLTVIEVHLSNPHTREPFRHHSYLADVVSGRIEGFGANSYRLALEAASMMIQAADPKRKN